MTILSGLNTSLTSLLTFSKALDITSDNLANLNSAGFKANDLVLRDLGDARGRGLRSSSESGLSYERGQGVEVTGTARRFTQGELRQTGTDTHLAISGTGFFVVRTPDGLQYTRAGQFQVNEKGSFVDSATGAILQRIDDGSLGDLQVNRQRVFPPSATKDVVLAGNLSRGGTTHQIDNVQLFDADGLNRNATLVFTADAAIPGRWTVAVTDSRGASLLNGEIRFDGSGAPLEGFNTLTLNLTATSGKTSTAILNFGQPGSLDAATSFSSGTNSTLAVRSADGFGVGTLTRFTVDTAGQLQLQYSNGQSEEGDQVALAQFADPQSLQFVGRSLFSAAEGQVPILGKPAAAGFGNLVAGSLELANVDLTSEFAQILILQRGFQSSSQVLNVTSELIETLYNNVSGRQ